MWWFGWGGQNDFTRLLVSSQIPNGTSCFDFSFQVEGNEVSPLDGALSIHPCHHHHPPNRHTHSSPEPPRPVPCCSGLESKDIWQGPRRLRAAPPTPTRGQACRRLGRASLGICWHCASQPRCVPKVGRELGAGGGCYLTGKAMAKWRGAECSRWLVSSISRSPLLSSLTAEVHRIPKDLWWDWLVSGQVWLSREGPAGVGKRDGSLERLTVRENRDPERIA